jgi:hypothetical protein
MNWEDWFIEELLIKTKLLRSADFVSKYLDKKKMLSGKPTERIKSYRS